MKKSKTTERTETAPLPPAPQTKRYSEAFKPAAVENWIKRDQPGPQIAAELGVSYPSRKEGKSRYRGAAMAEHGALEAETRTLRAELARVREPRAMLKKTLGLFTEPSPNATKPSKA